MSAKNQSIASGILVVSHSVFRHATTMRGEPVRDFRERAAEPDALRSDDGESGAAADE